jgi:hypothetical protein
VSVANYLISQGVHGKGNDRSRGTPDRHGSVSVCVASGLGRVIRGQVVGGHCASHYASPLDIVDGGRPRRRKTFLRKKMPTIAEIVPEKRVSDRKW